ncbi:HAMP domain-containing protein [Vibrio vulnificus]|uniref:ATP-binding protein n=1 Tax=Vibrio vulnificus TaxID=672 RepID=UPI000E579A10|nr:ATP-binding protein [Vibrio vulnificus]EKG2482666.1 HAMP domain-containing protein [Vibrio vulnificus]ELP6770663.1 HAMP domain-containing protein [Vibrio vulnificus]HDY7499666.1 HAMP domain-containing protein [Vibrio vulnificus]HDY7751428.1 HAMP domain-containing protein [Vibrio vulnificus]HDY8203211.1 HAMP domain-containing protein [Vibrio vulnificus]
MKRFRPNSLVARTLLLTLLAVVIAQGIATAIWYSESKQKELQGIRSASESMAGMFASTVTFFQSLPVRYRHIVLDQIRNMGGTRFFVSFNKQKLTVEPIADTPLKLASVLAVESVLQQKLTKVASISVDFSHPQNLRLLKDDIYLHDLPKSWAHHTLTLEPINPPVLVVQIELESHEWIYIAALLPAPYLTLDDTILGREQILFLFFSTTLLLVLTYTMIRRQVKPLKRLAKAANEMSINIEQPPLQEEGASELVTATRAFNRMQQRIRRYVADREHLFSAISHDLKTPITRLRIRAELLEDDTKRSKFNRDLDDLEMMVKGALQCVRDTDLHENNDYIDLNAMIEHVIDTYNQHHTKVHFRPIIMEPMVAKPLAIKRVLTNLIDNAVKYGEQAVVTLEYSEEWIYITIDDQGPGIAEAQLEAVFEPYFRLAKDSEGHGLGLGICRNILHGHGGDLIISNLPQGGLRAQVLIPKGLEV